MIRSFWTKGTEDVFDGNNSKRAGKVCPAELHTIARRKLDMIEAADELEDLKSPPGNRLEALTGNLRGRHSIRINQQYRICFRWTDAGAEDVEITDYH